MRNSNIIRYFGIVVAICALLICGCDRAKTKGEKEVRDFMEHFAEKVAANQLDSISRAYPEIWKVPALTDLNNAHIRVTQSSTNPEEYMVVINKTVTFKILHKPDGPVIILESHGLFRYPEVEEQLAKKTGLWDDNLNDLALLARMKDEDFKKFLIAKEKEQLNKLISIEKPKDAGDYYGLVDISQALTNNSDRPISGKDYEVKIKYEYVPSEEDGYDTYESGEAIEDGKDIPAHGMAYFEVEGGSGGFSRIVGIKWKRPIEELRDRYLSYSGREYQEYLDFKNNATPTPEENLIATDSIEATND